MSAGGGGGMYSSVRVCENVEGLEEARNLDFNGSPFSPTVLT